MRLRLKQVPILVIPLTITQLFTPGSDFELEDSPDIYLITEPWWHIGDEPDAPHFSVKEPSGLYPILPAQVIPADARPRVFACASSCYGWSLFILISSQP